MSLPAASQRLVASASALGLTIAVKEFPAGTKTAIDAAAAVGCPVSAIVKSLVFMADDEPVVVLMSGDLRTDLEKLADRTGAASVRRASLDEVRQATGFAAGGTPPFGHARTLRVFADHSLRRQDPVWAAAGTPTTVFPIALADLDRLVELVWTDLASDI